MTFSKIDSVPLANINSINSVSISNVEKINNVIKELLLVPEGLIIPYNSAAAVPAGWTLYNTADDKFIVGAGTTYAVDDNGAGTGDITGISIVASGNHNPGQIPDAGDGGGNKFRGTSSAGNHSHTIDVTPDPEYQGARLIKANAGNTEIPQNGVVLTDGTSLSGLSNIWTDGYLFKPKSSVTTGGSATVSATSTTAGAHSHGTLKTGTCFNNNKVAQEAGSHSHTVDLNLTYNIKRYLLAAWQDAAADIELAANMIGMYESITPPDGWYLCDGNNGTPDLRDYFIELTSSGSAGSSAGDNTVDVAYGAMAHGNHSHIKCDGNSIVSRALQHGSAAHATHANPSVNSVDNAWTPPYYALAFIMFGG